MSVKRWYHVVAYHFADGTEPDPDDEVWTISTDPNKCGWNTDSGTSGYGLKKATAEFLAQAANEKIAQDKSDPRSPLYAIAPS